MTPDWSEARRRAATLAELAAASAVPPSPAWLTGAAASLAEVAPTWRDLHGADPAARAYRPLVRAPQFEAWLICWPEGGRLRLHDHGGAAGALQVVDGALEELSLPGGTGQPVVRLLTAEQHIAFDGDYVHDVAHGGPAGHAATSVHVYGAASRSLRHYRLTPDGAVPDDRTGDESGDDGPDGDRGSAVVAGADRSAIRLAQAY